MCPTELIAFSEAIGSFSEINTSILGVSTDSHHTHLAWVKTPRTEGGLGKIEYPLLGDFSKEISRKYHFIKINNLSLHWDYASYKGVIFYEKIRETNIEDWYIELYEEFSCENKEQLNKREG